MALTRLQQLSVRCFGWVRAGMSRVRSWIEARPRVAAWVYPSREKTADARYRDFNERYFAGFHQQERMLADQPRMDFYQAAIARHIRPGDRVIDLGTGTGILAALASRCGAAKVYAIDHSAILEHARTLAADNRIANVEFVATHSTAFHLEEPVDVILHEQMGDCLFDESMVANIADLRDRLLRPGGRILPSQFDLYCEPIKVRDTRLVPFLWEMKVHGYDYSSLERHRPQDPDYYNLVSSDRNLVEHFLGQPAPLLSVDLHTLNEADLPREVRFQRTVVNAGRLDGYVIFFRARVDDDLTLGTGPLDAGRAPHWGFRILRTERTDYEVGDVIEVTLTVGRWTELETWRWRQVRRDAADQRAADACERRPEPSGAVAAA
jgi:protein arginine N-methyltransferase 1